MDALNLKHNWANGETWSETIHNADMEAIETTINKLTQSTEDGDSGAHNVKCATISGVDGTTVYAKLVALKALIDALVVGAIPIGSISEAMLSFAVATQAELDALAGVGNTATVKQAYDLANGIITTLTADGDMFGRTSGELVRIAKGTARQVLGMNATGTIQEYMASLQSLMTATGDLIVASSANNPARLALGSALNYLRVNSGGNGLEYGTLPYSMVYGYYTGNGSSNRTINIGFTPNMVLIRPGTASGTIITISSNVSGQYINNGGSIGNEPVTLVTNGFNVGTGGNNTNQNSYDYYYYAIK